MTANPCRAIIRGVSSHPTINIRSGPGTGHDRLFKVPVGAVADVIDAMPDAVENDFQGKIYQWLKLRFADGREGWVRDDLVDLEPGDCSSVGYGRLHIRTYAFALMRDETRRPTPAETEFPPRITQGSEIVAAPADALPADDSPLWIPAEDTPVETMPAAGSESDSGPTDETSSSVEAADEGCTGIVIMRDGANVRSGPSTRFDRVMHLVRGARAPILEVRPEAGGGTFRWLRIAVKGKEGWIREDLMRYEGSGCEALGLAVPDRYPAPMATGRYWWVRGFTGPQPNHPGWDLGAVQGEPVFCGPNGGLVITSFEARNATSEKPRTLDHGLSLGDPRIFSDPGWGWGYGHFVIVRYLHDLLPESTRVALAEKGMPGAHIFAIYAHLQTRSVQAGQMLSGGVQIGTCGTTGNSEAPHVHLEIRATTNANETSWPRMSSGLLDPTILFSR